MAGMLLSFANRWRDSHDACALVPFDRVFTGRVPAPEEYPFPYISIIPGGGRLVYRSDKWEGTRRNLSLHIWVDPDRLELGEMIAEMAHQLYANQSWLYDYGRVIDVLDGGPPNAHQINEPTFQAWEVVQLLTLCIEQPRVDQPTCPPGSSSGSASSLSSSGASPSASALSASSPTE